MTTTTMGPARARWFAALARPRSRALEDAQQSLDAAALVTRIGGAASMLRSLGVAPGDRVALLGAPSVEFVVAVLAAQAIGAIAVPMSPRHTEGELVHVVSDSDPCVLVLESTQDPRLVSIGPERRRVGLDELARVDAAPLEPVALEDEAIALLIYTSGTTGRSKGVALPWRALIGNMAALGRAWHFGPDDVLSLALPLFHVHGLAIGIFAAMLHGVAVRLHPRFDPVQVVGDVADHGASVFMGVPTMYVQLLAHLAREPDDAAVLARARLFTAGSAALAPDVFHRFEAATGHAILERYGMTETLITLSNPYQGPRRVGTVGIPVQGVEIRVVDDDGRPQHAVDGRMGELQVRGSSLMQGYWRDDAATAAAFDGPWFRTGDVVTIDACGHLRIVGRSSTDIIKSGGFKLSAREVEDVLRDHAWVADIAVFAVADATWGEHVTAAILPAPGCPALAELRAVLTAFARAHLADYKCPRQWLLLDELPRNGMGKLEKSALRRRVERDYADDVDLRAIQAR